ncbi:MAG: FAD-dependent oxidoreductase [Lachnospiraceae bacterium]|nr:FAD-dependent oxidoreductase [Lachnospiraceae bacterium]
MAKEVFMPKAGMDMQEGTIISWLVEVGDQVKAGEPLLEIETDKVTMEVESPSDGTLLVRYFEAGAVVPVVTIIGYVGEPGEKVPDGPAMAGGSARAGDEKMLMEQSSRDPEKTYEYRLAVIGAGSAGIRAALKAAALGQRVILFEAGTVGGCNIVRGGVPMKTYMQTAADLDEISRARGRGLRLNGEISFDLAELRSYKDEIVEKLSQDTRKRMRDAGVELVIGEAEMIGRHHIRAGQKTYRAENTILCTGSFSSRLQADGVEQPEIVTPEEMFELSEVPEKLVIIGGGVIGCEMATAWNLFGSEVTVIEMQDHLLPTFDTEVTDAVAESMRERGIRIVTGGKVARFDRRNNKPVLVLADGSEYPADIILTAVGRKPNLSPLGVLKDRIDYERGKIMVDEYCRTNLDGIYACGDVTNQSILAHSAMKMGEAAASTACGRPKEVHLNRAPLNLYTIPEAAGIGLTEAQAAKNGDIMIGRCPLALNERGITSGRTEGFVKVIADKGYGEILGVHIFGGTATEMIVEAKTMMDMEITVYEVKDIMHAHPTWSEAFMEACADAVGERLIR